MRKRSLVAGGLAIAALFSLATNCSSKAGVKKLNRKTATQLLKDYYGDPKTLVTEGETAMMVFEEMPWSEAAYNAGLIRVEFLRSVGYMDFICVTLSDKGKALSKQWEKKKGEKGEGRCVDDTSWRVPIGHLDRLEVTGIRKPSEIKALVDLEIEYDINKTGKAFRDAGVNNPKPYAEAGSNLWEDTFEATASLELYDDGWRVISVE